MQEGCVSGRFANTQRCAQSTISSRGRKLLPASNKSRSVFIDDNTLLGLNWSRGREQGRKAKVTGSISNITIMVQRYNEKWEGWLQYLGFCLKTISMFVSAHRAYDKYLLQVNLQETFSSVNQKTQVFWGLISKSAEREVMFNAACMKQIFNQIMSSNWNSFNFKRVSITLWRIQLK